MAITNRDLCDFTVHTKQSTSVKHIGFNSQFWINNMLSKVTEFYDVFLSSHCITIVGIKMHDLRLSFKIVS